MLAKALIAANGDLGHVDMDAVGRAAHEQRAAYYGQRLDTGTMADDPALAVAIISKIGTGHVDFDLSSMVAFVRDQANSLGGLHRSRKGAEAFLEEMVRHGILVRRRSPDRALVDRWTVAVPSMAAWAEQARAAAGTE